MEAKNASHTFSRIDSNPSTVQLLLTLPVFIPGARPQAEQDNDQRQAAHNTPLLPTLSAMLVQDVGPLRHQQAEPHAGNVQNSLSHNETDVKKQVGRRHKRKDDYRQRHHQHVQRPGRRQRPRNVYAVRWTAGIFPLVSHWGSTGVQVTGQHSVAIGVHFLRCGQFECRQAFPDVHADAAKAQIKNDGGNITYVTNTLKKWNGFHGPVKAESVRVQKQPNIDWWQVMKSQSSSQETVRVRCWIVWGCKLWGFAAHKVDSKSNQTGATGKNAYQSFQQRPVIALEQK